MQKLATNRAARNVIEKPLTRGNKHPRGPRDTRDGSSSLPSSEGSLPAALPRRKRSFQVEATTAENVLAAIKHSFHLGCAPNRHLTINWQAAGVSDPITATGKLLKLIRDAAKRAGLGGISYIWAREVGIVVGEHVHILLYVPPASGGWFAKNKPGWLRLCGARKARGVSKTRVIRGAKVNEARGSYAPELFHGNLANLTAYVLKHCSPEVQRLFGIDSRGSCELVGKRVSISQNLNRGARTDCVLCAQL